jgi:hypothetical protein
MVSICMMNKDLAYLNTLPLVDVGHTSERVLQCQITSSGVAPGKVNKSYFNFPYIGMGVYDDPRYDVKVVVGNGARTRRICGVGVS